MAADESLSLEETNKVRISLGLAPLAGEDGDENDIEAGSDVEPDKDAIAEANYAQRCREEAQARTDKETKERLAKARNQRDLRAKLSGKGLGEADAEDSESAAAADWVKQSRKRAKQRAAELEKLRLREKELDDRDREATYGEEDLAGLKVAHGIKDFEEGKDVVLTLADRKVLDDEDDELQNINLAEYARTAERLDLKKKGKTAYKYTGYDEQEEQFDPENIGKAKSVLSKYDEEIGLGGSGSSKDGGFRLGGAMPASTSASSAGGGGRAAIQETEQRELNRDLLSLDYSKLEQTDYLQEGDVGFKKPKKKKMKSSKSSRRAVALDDGDDLPSLPTEDTEMADNDTPKVPTAERRLAKEGGAAAGDGAVIDDEDLQAALARQRRAAGKKRIQAMKEEETARRTMQESSISANGAGDEDMMPAVKTEEGDVPLNGHAPKIEEDEDDGLLIMNDTSEFIRNISARPLISKKDQPNNRNKNKQNGGAFVKVKSEPRDDDEGDVPLDEVDMSTKVEEEEDEEPEEGEALSEEDTGMALDNTAGEEDVKPDIRNGSSTKEDDKNPSAGFGSTADEKLISGGMASTLSLLRQSGLIKPLTPEEIERDRAYKEKERFIAEARLRDAQRDMERARLKASGSGGSGEGTSKKGNAAANQAEQTQREYENKRLQFQHAQKTLEAFKDYKPNVEITYHDEFGRNLTPKEAWKDLSHKFHGKGSGTNKREKLLKKIEEERKREAMASGDSPLNTNTAFQARQERLGTATMVLGVGNKNAAPSADILLGSSASGKAGVNIAKRGNPAAGPSGSNKRKKDGPKVLG